MKSLLARIVFLSLLLFSVSHTSAQPKESAAGEIIEGVVAVIASLHRGKKVEQIIYFSDLERFHAFFQHRKEALDREAQLDRVIHHLLLRPEARRFVLEKPPQESVNARLRSTRHRFQDERRFQAALQKTGLLLDELKAEIVEHLWVEELIKERIKEFIFITPKAIDKYYRKHRDSFPGRRLEEVEPVIESILRGEKEGVKKQEYLDRLKEKVTIKILLKQGEG